MNIEIKTIFKILDQEVDSKTAFEIYEGLKLHFEFEKKTEVIWPPTEPITWPPTTYPIQTWRGPHIVTSGYIQEVV